jgi:hypothetical protein
MATRLWQSIDFLLKKIEPHWQPLAAQDVGEQNSNKTSSSRLIAVLPAVYGPNLSVMLMYSLSMCLLMQSTNFLQINKTKIGCW